MTQGAGGVLAGLQAVLSAPAYALVANGAFAQVTFSPEGQELSRVLARDFDDELWSPSYNAFYIYATQWVRKYLPADASAVWPSDIGTTEWKKGEHSKYWRTSILTGSWSIKSIV